MTMKNKKTTIINSFLSKALLAIVMLFGIQAFGQTYSLPATGTNTSITTCAGTIYDLGGSAGNYANSYSGYTVINPSTAGNMVQLTGTIATESGYDYVYIYNGTTATGTPLYTGSGSANIGTITSTTGALTVKFTSDASTVGAGFALSIACIVPENKVPSTGNNSYTLCSGTLYDNGGSAANYINSSNGYTVINPTTTGNMVQLTGTIATESGYDYVYIYNGSAATGTPLYTGTGTANIGTITSTSGSLTVKFTSDVSGVAAGFALTVACVVPSAPSCVASPTSPTNAQTSIALNSSLSWPSVASATGYDVYFSTSSTPTTLVSTNQSGTSYTPSASLTANTTYYWQIVPKNTVGSSTGCSVWRFTTGTPPACATSYTSPTNGQANIGLSSALSWSSISGATGYDVYLSTSSTPTTLVSSNQSGTTYTPSTALSANSTYYWSVVPRNSIGAASSCLIWSFNTEYALPASGSNNSITTCSGTINDNGGSNGNYTNSYTGYTVINPATAGNMVQLTGSIVTESGYDYVYIYNGSAATGTPLYTGTGSVNIGTITSTSGSLTIKFTSDISGVAAGFALTVACVAPSAPSCVASPTSPTNAQANIVLSSSLSWPSVAGATGYDVYVSTSSTPTTLVSTNQAGTSYTPSASLTANTTYYWKVIPKNAVGSSTGCSVWSFTTAAPPVCATTYTSPTNAQSNVGLSSSLSWPSISGATGYDVYLSTSSTPTTLVSSNQAGITYTPSTALLANTTYYWSVVPRNSVGAASSCLIWSFNTEYALPASGSNNTITACSGTINDNGGSNGNYTNSYSGYTVINPAVVGNVVRLTGSINTESGYDYVYVYDGSGTSGTLLWSGSGSSSIGTVTSTSGSLTVKMTSDGSAVYSGFSLTIACVPPPVNPCNFISALTCGVSSNYALAAATGSWDNLGGTWSTPGSEKVFSYTPSVSSLVSISLTNNENYVDLYYKTATCGSTGWTYLSDFSSSGGSTSLTLTAGTTYYFLIDDENIIASNGTISVSCAPTADYSYTAPFAHSGSTCGAGNDCSLESSEDRVYAVTVTDACSYTFSLCGSSYDTKMYLTSALCGGTTLASNDDYCSTQSQFTVALSPGTYYLDIEGYAGACGNYTLNVTSGFSGVAGTISGSAAICSPASGTYSIASITGATGYNWVVPAGVTITSGQGTNSVSLSFASTYSSGSISVMPSNSCGNGTSSSLSITSTNVDYSFTAPFSHTGTTCGKGDNLSVKAGEDVLYEVVVSNTCNYTFSLCGSSFDTYMYLLSARCGGSTIISNDDYCSTQSQFSITLTPGTYYLDIEPYSSAACGAYSLNVTTTYPGVAGAISGPAVNCGANNATYTIANVTAATNYNWTVPTGVNIISGQGSNSITVSFASTFANGSISVVPSNNCGIGTGSSKTITHSSVTASSTATSILCNGGSATVSVTANGGTAPYSGTGNFNVNTGNYSYTVTDAIGCTSNTSIVVSQPSILTTASSATSILCNGGSATVSVTANGGNAPYTGTGNFNVNAGNLAYTVTDANGCTSNTSVVVSQPSVLTASSSAIAILCNEGTSTITVVANGGVAPYSGAGTFVVTAGNYSYTVTDANGCSATTSVVVSEPSALSVVSSATAISCNGGSATVTISAFGGIAPYTGAGEFTVNAGNHSYVVTDANGCLATVSIVTEEPEELVATSSSTTILCNGASAVVSIVADGGSAPYTGTGDFTVNAGNYSYTVTDVNGCSTSTSLVVSQPSALSASASATAILCNEGTSTITVVANGGVAPYSGTGAFIVTAGNYSYTVTDANGCSATTSVVVSEPSTLSVVSSATAISCNGGSATVTISAFGGIAPYTGAGEFTVNAGSHSYVVTDANGCSATASIITDEPEALVASSSSSAILCNGASSVISVIADGGSAPYVGVGDFTVNAGNYSYTVTDVNGCSTSTSVVVSEPSALTVASSATSILCNGGAATVNVTANGGSVPYTGTGDFTVNAGNYSYTVTDANGCASNTSVVVSQPSVLSAVSSATSILCNGGSATVSVTANGGTAPFAGTGNFTVTAGNYSYTVTDVNGCSTSTSIVVSEPAALTAASSATSILCNGGSATVSVTANGGTAPYTGTGSFNVNAGNYSYTVTDANTCASNTSVVVSQPSILSAVSSATSILCNGGSSTVSVVANGGTAPYTGTGNYTVTAGNYSYTVTDAHGCISNTSVAISQPSILTANSSSSLATCTSTKATVIVSAIGGTVPYTGTGTFNNVNFGNYSYVVTDAKGCTSSTTGFAGKLTASSTSTAILCKGGNSIVTVTAIGGSAPYTGIGNFTVQAGNYSFTVTDSKGCKSTTTGTVSQPTKLNAVASAGSILCNGGSGTITISANGGIAPYTGIGNFIVPAGNYSYIVTDANGCSASISKSITQPNVLIATSTVESIHCNGGTTTVHVSANGGKTPYTGTGNYSISAGNYSYIVTDANGCTATTSGSVSEPSAITISSMADQVVYRGYAPMACATLNPVVSGGTPNYEFEWSNGGHSNSATICPSTSKTYTLTVEDSKECKASATVNICVVDVRCGLEDDSDGDGEHGDGNHGEGENGDDDQEGNSYKGNVFVCHDLGGGASTTLCVPAASVAQHLAHGDALGTCGQITCNTRSFANANNTTSKNENLVVKLYPNPTSSLSSILISSQTNNVYTISIYNIDGKLMKQINNVKVKGGIGQEVGLDLSDFSSGTYLVNIKDENNISKSVILVKQN